MPGVKRVQLDGWGSHSAGKVICVDSERTNPTYQYNFNATPTVPSKPPSSAYAPYSHNKAPSMGFGQMSAPTPPTVDVFQAEIAKTCNAIAKQAPQLPVSMHGCSVCLTANAHTQIVPCGHIFHSRCFLRWFRTNRSCPLCRGSVGAVQLAPTVVATDVIEEVDALMADDSDDDDMDVSSPQDMMDSTSLMEDHELMNFLSDDSTSMTDTDLLPIEDMEILEDMTFGTPEKVALPQNKVAYTPATTMPNYWMILNNGQTLNPAMRPPQQPALAAPRMVHIAPRPKTGSSAQLAPTLAPMPSMSGDMKSVSMVPQPTKTNSCRCAGGCRNGRCACVKEGSMCGVTCRCTSCKNPFLSIAMAGIDVSSLIKDDCFMHNLSKIRDMMAKLHERIAAPCCPDKEISILQCIDGYTCDCGKAYDFSWCSNKLCDREKHRRNHCSKCKRCGDHRDVHCDDCNRCYFAGVSSSFACPCKEKQKTVEKKEGDENEGECTIM
ncbi:unnamed protein product [Aphanomyces euteiches]